MRVLLPTRKVPLGLLNGFLSIENATVASYREEEALEWLVWETYASYSDPRVLDCPLPGCDTKSRMLKELKMHVWRDPHKGKAIEGPHKYRMMKYHPNIPEEVKAALDAKQRRFDELSFTVTVLKEDCSSSILDMESQANDNLTIRLLPK